MLRDPVEMLYSLHGRRHYGGSEDLADFAEALAAEPERKQGRRISPKARNVTALFYRDVGSYYEQVKRYLDTFGPDRVHIIIFEDFRADPATAYRQTLEFLGVDPTFEPNFNVVNGSRRAPKLAPTAIPAVAPRHPSRPDRRFLDACGRTWAGSGTRSTRAMRSAPPLDP
jgi:hypothetical protein